MCSETLLVTVLSEYLNLFIAKCSQFCLLVYSSTQKSNFLGGSLSFSIFVFVPKKFDLLVKKFK